MEGGSSKGAKNGQRNKGNDIHLIAKLVLKEEEKTQRCCRGGMETGNGAGKGKVQEAKVTPVTTSHHFLGSGFVTAGQENPQSPYTQCSFQGARIENNQYPHLLSDI